MLFEEQLSRKPNLYPWTQDFIDAMWKGHWTPNEFNFQSDIQNFKTDLNEKSSKPMRSLLGLLAKIKV